MKTTPIDSKFFQNRVQFAAQVVALTERLPFPRAEKASRNGLVDKNGNTESPAAERLLQKFKSGFLAGVGLAESI